MKQAAIRVEISKTNFMVGTVVADGIGAVSEEMDTLAAMKLAQTMRAEASKFWTAVGSSGVGRA